MGGELNLIFEIIVEGKTGFSSFPRTRDGAGFSFRFLPGEDHKALLCRRYHLRVRQRKEAVFPHVRALGAGVACSLRPAGQPRHGQETLHRLRRLQYRGRQSIASPGPPGRWLTLYLS